MTRNSESSRSGKNRMGGLFGRKRRGNWGQRARVFISRSQSELKGDDEESERK